MSVVTIQVGQCGNQIGLNFLSAIMNDLDSVPTLTPMNYNQSYQTDTLSRFFYESEKKEGILTARAVMIDTEMKVIDQIRSRSQRNIFNWSYCDKSIYCHKRGSGNNWADGYKNHGTACAQVVEGHIRHQLERCDYLDGLLLCMSLAGGTGSGVGTRIVELLRDELNKCPQLACVVWPHSRGEVSTQCYNSILSTSHLLATSAGVDGLVVMENDLLQDACIRRLGLSHVAMQHLNEMIAHQLCCLLMPVENERASLSAILNQLCCHPDFKLIKLKCLPYVSRANLEFGTETWPMLLKHLKQMLIVDAHVDEAIDWSIKATQKRSLTLSSALICRGPGCEVVNEVDDGDLRDPKLYSSTIDETLRYKRWNQRRGFYGYKKSVLLAVNGQACVRPIEEALQKAWRMFHANAFLHPYYRHHFKEENFMDSFASVEQLLHNYKFCL